MITLYIAITIAILCVIGLIFLTSKNKKGQRRLSQLAAMSLISILAGIAMGESNLIGYSLIFIGVVIAITDIMIKEHFNRHGK
jgi:hypothetical protein